MKNFKLCKYKKNAMFLKNSDKAWKKYFDEYYYKKSPNLFENQKIRYLIGW